MGREREKKSSSILHLQRSGLWRLVTPLRRRIFLLNDVILLSSLVLSQMTYVGIALFSSFGNIPSFPPSPSSILHLPLLPHLHLLHTPSHHATPCRLVHHGAFPSFSLLCLAFCAFTLFFALSRYSIVSVSASG